MSKMTEDQPEWLEVVKMMGNQPEWVKLFKMGENQPEHGQNQWVSVRVRFGHVMVLGGARGLGLGLGLGRALCVPPRAPY